MKKIDLLDREEIQDILFDVLLEKNELEKKLESATNRADEWFDRYRQEKYRADALQNALDNLNGTMDALANERDEAISKMEAVF